MTASDAQGHTTQVVYNGSAQRASSPIGETQTVATFYTGSEVFQSQQRGPTVITGTTGAAAGSGTDSATGQGALVVAHTSTTYAVGSGVQPGASSATGDTILGPIGAHTDREIRLRAETVAAGTVSLDNGPAIPFTSAQHRPASHGG